MSKRKPHGYWTKERCLSEALKYEFRRDFRKQSSGAYSASVDKGWLAEITSHMPTASEITAARNKAGRKWTKEACIADAAKFDHRVDWQKSGSAYCVASRNGWLNECCAHMKQKENTGRFSITRSIDECKAAALKYESRADWIYGDIGSYKTAMREGWLEECCAHMTSKGSDNDVVYIWRDEVTSLHKIGITSDRLGEFRIGGFNKDVEPSIVFMLKVPDARAVESKLLELGTAPELDSSIDGYTEFRRLTDAELGQAVSVAYEAALAA